MYVQKASEQKASAIEKYEKYENSRSSSVDLGKYVASLLIIAIHTGLLRDVNETAGFVLVDIFCRFAVPFFAVCTGFFLSKKYVSKHTEGENAKETAQTRRRFHISSAGNGPAMAGGGALEAGRHVFPRQWRKIFLLYVIWSVVYMLYLIPKWIDIDWFSAWAFVDYGIAAVKSGSYYHMWYLLCLLYAIPLFWLCLRFISARHYRWMIPVLWAVKALIYGYAQWMPAPVSDIFEKMGLFSGLRDGVFMLLPLLLTGFCIQQSGGRCLRFYAVGFIISCVGLFAEAFALRAHGQDAVSYIFFTLPCAYFLFRLVIRMKIPVRLRICRILGAASLFIYCVHPFVYGIVDRFIVSSIWNFIVVAVIAKAAGIVSVFIRKQIVISFGVRRTKK